MLNLYKKVEKTNENMQGSILLDECPFDKPCLLAVSAQDMPKSVFGITKIAMRMARLRTRNNLGERYDLSNFPVSFLAIRNEINITQKIKEFVDNYVSKILIGSREEVKRNLRNINILAYCDGVHRVKRILEEIENKLIENGFDNVNELMSQISLITLSTEVDLSDVKATVIDFHDINDTEAVINPNNITDEMIDSLNGEKETIIVESKTKASYLFDGSGSHDLKQYFTDCVALSPSISKVISNVLKSSIEGKELDTSVACEGVEVLLEQNVSREKLMEKVDSEIEYKGATKLTERECKLLDELDKTYDKYLNMERDINRLEYEKNRAVSRNEKMLDVSRSLCDNITYLKILQASGYQLSYDQLKLIEGSSKENSEETNKVM